MGWVRRIALLSAVAAGAYVAVSAGMAAGMTRAVRIRPEDDPSAVGLAFSDVSFRSRDGELELAGWLVPPQGEQGALDPALSRWIVMVHGFGTNRANPAAGGLGLARDLSNRGYGLLMFDLRGCGDSGGDSGSVGFYERLDLLGALDFLVASGVDRGRVGVHGSSLGAAIALMTCSNPGTAAAVVADSSFADLTVRVRESLTGSKKPLYLFTPGMEFMARLMFGLDIQEVSPARMVAATDTPIFIVHGESDEMVPVRHARILGRAIGADAESPASGRGVWIVPGAGHVQGYRTRRGEYVNRVAGFFDRHLAA
jgi:dipeptidyl aminopeptidase/acylaminoacyl peptidase